MDTGIRMPFLERRRDNLHIQKAVQPNGATAFPARSFVKLAAGILVPCVTADVLCYGWTPDRSHAADEVPPQALYGQNHWPFDPNDAIFLMNITDAAGHIGQASGAPQLAAAVVGTSYGLYRDGTTGYQMLNVADTTTKFAKVVGYYPNQALTDYNGLVLVEVLPAVIQG
jgi:hypothetical protein